MSFSDIFGLLLRSWWLLVLCALIGFLFGIPTAAVAFVLGMGLVFASQ